MATITTNRDLRQVLTTSMFSRRSEVQDLVYNSNPITALLRENGSVRAYDGGPEIRIPLMIDKLDAQWFTGYDKLRIEPKELVNTAVFTPKRVTSMFSLTGTELLYNQGRAQVIDLMDLYLSSSEEGIREAMEVAVVGDGTGQGGRQMVGFGGAVPIIANSGVYGGIDRGAHEIWRTSTFNIPAGDVAGYTVWDSTTARPIIERIIAQRSKGRRHADLLIADINSYQAISASMVAHQRITSTRLGKLGFDALEIATPAGAVAVVAATGVGNVMPANTIYGLDTAGLELVYHPNNNMVPMHEGEGAKPINQDAVAQGYVWTGELILSNPRYTFRIITA